GRQGLEDAGGSKEAAERSTGEVSASAQERRKGPAVRGLSSYEYVASACSPDERQRNPGTMMQVARSFPHFAGAQCGLRARLPAFAAAAVSRRLPHFALALDAGYVLEQSHPESNRLRTPTCR